MEYNKNKTNTILLMVIGIATLLVAVVGATFAYFTAQITGDESTTTIYLQAGELTIGYADGSDELKTVATGIVPSNDNSHFINKRFTLTGNNNTSTVMPYTIYMVVTENTFSDAALEYKLIPDGGTSDGKGGTLTKTDTWENWIKSRENLSTYDGSNPALNGTKVVELGTGNFKGITPTEGINHVYDLYIYFRNQSNVNQDTDKDKTFAGYIRIDVAAATEITG